MINFIEIFDNALTTEESKFIIDYMNQNRLLSEGLITVEKGIAVDKKYKDSSDISLNFLNKEYTAQRDGINADNGAGKVNDIIFPNLIKGTEKYIEIHHQVKRIHDWSFTSAYNLQKYNPGQGYHAKHCENCDLSTSNRVLAWMFYLNTVTDDGGTYFDNYDLIVNAKEGRLVIWPAYWTHLHKGIMSKTQTKYIATGWCEYVRYSSTH